MLRASAGYDPGYDQCVAEQICLVNGLPGAGKSTLAKALAVELGVTLLSKDTVKEVLFDARCVSTSELNLGGVAMDVIWRLAADSHGPVIIESWWFRPRDLNHVRSGLELAGAVRSLEIWCEVAPSIAIDRYLRRQPNRAHDDAGRLRADWQAWATPASQPLAIGPVLTVDTHTEVDVRSVAESVRRELLRSGDTGRT